MNLTYEDLLCQHLQSLPAEFGNRYSTEATNRLIQLLFSSLFAHSKDYVHLFFPNGPPSAESGRRWSLREAQGAIEGAEYSEAARGHPCGHIFKYGEATYRCRTCTADDTCVLCARCFEASDHEGHNVFVNLSPGNAGCCDCGDTEAWLRPVNCSIHTAQLGTESKAAGKAKEGSSLPPDLVNAIQMTIARALDYLCDVFSCSPEQLRLPKTESSVFDDERQSRLPRQTYGGPYTTPEADTEFALILWNDEKHTVNDVRDQVARACRMALSKGLEKAHEVNDIGRSVVIFSKDLPGLLQMAKIIEQPKLTVTVRSARDTFREQMCATIVEWISDIAGCSVGQDPNILRDTICEELLKGWRIGSEAHHKSIGKDGIDDHEVEDISEEFLRIHGRYPPNGARVRRIWRLGAGGGDVEDSDGDPDEDEPADDDEEMDVDEVEGGDQELEMVDDIDDALETSEATFAGYPPPPPPPPNPARRNTGSGSVAADDADQNPALMSVPKTPKINQRSLRNPRPPRYWLEKPEGYSRRAGIGLAEDLWKRVRLDYLILFDLRMWKKLRTDLRDVFISTVVTLPFFKRLLGLRFAGVYTVLAELYLIADREPEHSIISLSLQMLTTPSITVEIVERGNFLTNLMAILYTFLTTRQVGYPSDVNLSSTLAFEAGAVTNRRIYHFYMDMKYLLASELVQERIKTEERYLMQFLDLAKLHQGICPNFRAVGDHVEYEADTWISANLIIQEIIKLCKSLSESFVVRSQEDLPHLCRAIRYTAKTTTINSLGYERTRYDQSEIKEETRFKTVLPYEFEEDPAPLRRIVDYVVEREPMSFHHALHYTLSWLIDRGKSMSSGHLVRLLTFSDVNLHQPSIHANLLGASQPEERLLALFDFPLRVLAWLAQMRAGMWVRNGITLRHQSSAHRTVQRAPLSHHRDIFMVQVALVVCRPATVLASIVDRFNVTSWITGDYQQIAGQEEQQRMDVAEDFVHLLIVLLSDRTNLIPLEDDPHPQVSTARRDIIHALCFKPLLYSELTSKMADKLSESEEFDKLLDELAVYKPPEGLSDYGTFALKPQFLEELDPYLTQFSRNQRDEAENIYRKYLAEKTGTPQSEVVYEPRLRPIKSGLFKNLSGVTRQPLFAQIIFYLLQYAMVADRFETNNIPATKVEQFLQFVLHLTLIAVLEDDEADESMQEHAGTNSFCHIALTKHAKITVSGETTIAGLLRRISETDTLKFCEAKARRVLRHLRHRRPVEYQTWMNRMNLPVERSTEPSPAPSSENKELKKKQALERQARVMAQFKQQQNSFLQNQSMDWVDDYTSEDDDFATPPEEEEEEQWKYPTGSCILCQEDVTDEKLYGTFALMNESRIFRQTDVTDDDWVREVMMSPLSLDRDAEPVRPFGVAGQNRYKLHKVTSDGKVVELERQGLAKGFPCTHTKRGPVATGCGHIMHFTCFDIYIQAVLRRHSTQIARNQPERVDLKEFLCPLCKALGNAFLPIIWKGKAIQYPGVLRPDASFDNFLSNQIGIQISKLGKGPERAGPERADMRTVMGESVPLQRLEQLFLDYGNKEMIPTLASKLPELVQSFASNQTAPTSSARPTGINQGTPFFNILTNTGDFLNVGPPPPEPANTGLTPPMLELVKTYHRLRETMRVNGLGSQFMYPLNNVQDDLTFTDTLAKSLGYSIAAAEIAQRGVESEHDVTFLDKISSQTLTHLRILSETVTSFTAIGGLRHGGANLTNREFFESQLRQMRQLFVGHPDVCDISRLKSDESGQMQNTASLMTLDPFIFLSECAACLVPALHLDIHHVMRLCYIAELVRVVLAFRNYNVQMADRDIVSRLERDAGDIPDTFNRFVQGIVQGWEEVQTTNRAPQKLDLNAQPVLQVPAVLYKFAQTYALSFVRKCAILMQVRYGVEFPRNSAHPDDTELTRLSRALRLPQFDDMISEVIASESTKYIIFGWMWHYALVREGRPSSRLALSLGHPCIFELVGLPKNFDTLQDEAMRRRCPKTGKEQTDPVVCLFCGEIFCSQAICCATDNGALGGCYNHRSKCGGTIGMFINIRKCMVICLNNKNGSWTIAPYLDKHGEADPTLRRHHQLFLNQRRYDVLLRTMWLQHLVQSTIARKLEGDTNNGGWETL
ncbi:hypothetical protein EJ06DRAFT_490957 [Trichodelitschia bisporula]|uniref:E3 ubiquitin-protein ligase n=1 Tax=Trichodelitschia bisporula TaxID=703511 RepID=A0A6G1I2Y4_9PEZI|nr:hypothetical protein EJ06DRAFT_490957 [Trichodelitschia bisporula]